MDVWGSHFRYVYLCVSHLLSIGGQLNQPPLRHHASACSTMWEKHGNMFLSSASSSLFACETILLCKNQNGKKTKTKQKNNTSLLPALFAGKFQSTSLLSHFQAILLTIKSNIIKLSSFWWRIQPQQHVKGHPLR